MDTVDPKQINMGLPPLCPHCNKSLDNITPDDINDQGLCKCKSCNKEVYFKFATEMKKPKAPKWPHLHHLFPRKCPSCKKEIPKPTLKEGEEPPEPPKECPFCKKELPKRGPKCRKCGEPFKIDRKEFRKKLRKGEITEIKCEKCGEVCKPPMPPHFGFPPFGHPPFGPPHMFFPPPHMFEGFGWGRGRGHRGMHGAHGPHGRHGRFGGHMPPFFGAPNPFFMYPPMQPGYDQDFNEEGRPRHASPQGMRGPHMFPGFEHFGRHHMRGGPHGPHGKGVGPHEKPPAQPPKDKKDEKKPEATTVEQSQIPKQAGMDYDYDEPYDNFDYYGYGNDYYGDDYYEYDDGKEDKEDDK